MTHYDIEEVAQAAAELYGQEWAKLPMYSKEIWRENVRQLQPGVIRSEAERCAAAAVEQWQTKQVEPAPVEPEEAKPVEKKSKSKK